MPLVLWREDLDEIISILQRREGAIQFVADDYTFEKLDELETHFGVRDKNELKITSTKPYVSLELNDKQAWLFVSADSQDASGVFFELDKVLIARQRRFPALYTFWFTSLLNIFIIAMSIFYNQQDKTAFVQHHNLVCRLISCIHFGAVGCLRSHVALLDNQDASSRYD